MLQQHAQTSGSGKTAVGLPEWEDPARRGFVQIREVGKTFGDFVAVEGVTLDIARGELFTLLGGSGCGKTTLLRMLAGFEEPTSGKIFIDSADMSGIPPYERPVNIMFQSYALFPHMTVEQNIAYGLHRDKMDSAKIRSRTADMIDLVQLAPFARRRPHQLSGGQQQRVALARALVKNPKLLLLDEPLGALDKKLREQTQFELMNIQEQLGVTFIVVTHDQEEAMVLSTRIAVMRRGCVVQVGEPAEVYERPCNKFVADFVGTINLLSGALCDGGFACSELGQTLRVNAAAHTGVPTHLAVRPEKITISKEKPVDETCNIVAGVVLDLAYMGGMSIYRVKIGSGFLLKVAAFNNRIGESPASWDDSVYLSWRTEDSILLSD